MKFVFTKYREFLIENIKVFIGLGGSLLLIFLVVWPGFTSIPALYSQNNEEAANLATLKEKQAKIDGLITSAQAVKSGILLADKALPSKDDVPILLNQIQTIATGSGVTLKSLQFSGIIKAESGSHKKVAIQAVMEGSFSNIESMLTNFENTTRIINLSSLSFDSRKNEGNLTVNLGLVSYFLENDPKSSAALSLDLSASQTNATLDYLKKLKPYEPQIINIDVGKSNPFE